MAATAIGTSAWPEISTTGRAILRRDSSRTSSMPSMPGMRTSATMQPGRGLGECLQESVGRCVGFDLVAEHAQHLAQRVAHRLLIIDDEDRRAAAMLRQPCLV